MKPTSVSPRTASAKTGGSVGASAVRGCRGHPQLAAERAREHHPLDRDRHQPRQQHQRGEARERQAAGVERQQVGEVRDRQQQRRAVGEVGARVHVRARAEAQPRGGREHDRREQHDRGVEAQHRGRAGGDQEHEPQQPPRPPAGAGRHRGPEVGEQPGAAAAVRQHEQRGGEPDRRPEVLERVARAGRGDRAGQHQQRGGARGDRPVRQPLPARDRGRQHRDERDEREDGAHRAA